MDSAHPTYANLEDRVIRIFISSTFSDMAAERDILVKSVFPRLAAIAEKRDVRIVPLDLRWGITDDMARSGRVIETCLNEIVHAQPFFLGLIGHRYGSCLTASEAAKNRNLLRQYQWLEQDMIDGLSVTEIEIQYGVLRNPRPIDAFFYLKEDAMPDNDNPEKLTRLKRLIRENGRYPCAEYATPEELAAKVETAFRELLDNRFPVGPQSGLERERRSQRAFQRSRLTAYVPNREALDVLDRFLNGSKRCLVVTGASGMGKSALLANWVESLGGETRRRTICHFVGNGDSEGDFRAIQQRLCLEIRDLYGLPAPDSLESDRKARDKELQRLAARIPDHTPLLIVLDGVNQLHDEEQAKLLSWLPAPGAGVRYLFSTLEEDRTMEIFKARNYPTLTLQPLTVGQRMEVIRTYLKTFGKELSAERVERIAHDPLCENTLVLRLLLDELVGFGCHEQLDERIGYYLDSQDTEGFFQRVLQRIEEDLGKEQVRQILSLLVCSRAGMSEPEIMQATGVSTFEWSLFLGVFRHHLTTKGGLLTFSHRYMAQACRERYADGEAETRQRIIGLFGDTPTERAWSELAFQYHRLQDGDRLYELLLHLRVFEALYRRDEYQLGRYWNFLLETDSSKYRPEGYLEVEFDDDQDLLDFYNRVGIFFTETVVRPDVALVFQQEVLSICRQLQRVPPQYLSGACNSIGTIYVSQGKYDLALQSFGEALDMRREPHDAAHPELAMIYSNIGSAHLANGEPAQALEYLTRAYGIYRELYGEEHPDTAEACNSIGGVYHAQGNCEKALEYYDRALQTVRRLFGEEYPDTALGYNNVGVALQGMGKPDQALEYQNKALEIVRKLFGEVHPHAVRILNNIGTVRILTGNPEQALACFERALQINRMLFGEEHPDTILILRNMGLIYNQLGQSGKARHFFLQAKEICIALYGKEDPRTAGCMDEIGSTFHQPESYKWGLYYAREAVRINRMAQGNSRDTALYEHHCGMFCSALGKYGEALQHYLQSLEIRLEIDGRENDDVIGIYNQIGTCHRMLSDCDKALEAFNEALAISRSLHKEENLITAITYHNLGKACTAKGRWSEAVEYFQKALEIQRKKSAEEDNLTTGLLYVSIGEAYDSMGETGPALDFLAKGLEMQMRVVGEKHPRIRKIRKQIRKIRLKQLWRRILGRA